MDDDLCVYVLPAEKVTTELFSGPPNGSLPASQIYLEPLLNITEFNALIAVVPNALPENPDPAVNTDPV